MVTEGASTGGPTWERSTKVWFGPIKRASTLLEKGRVVVDPQDAIDEFRAVLGQHFAAIEHIRFIDCTRKDKGNKRFTIALCWTRDDPPARQALYELAPTVVERTGWYPLPQGRRLNSTRDIDRRLPRVLNLDALGTPDTVQAAVKPEGGCSIRLTLTGGASVLLDTGFPGRIAVDESDRVAFVSHVHMDHAGGLVSGCLPPSLPTLMSDGTRRLLTERGYSWPESSTHAVRAGTPIALGPETELTPFPVPHLPGAYGCVVRGGGHSIVFTSDISLRSAHHDFVPTLQDMVREEEGQTTVLLDATMAGRSDLGAGTNDAANELLAAEWDDVVLIGDSAEHLLYAYLDLFHSVKEGERRDSVSFLVTGGLRSMFGILHRAFIRREIAELDPFLLSQYGTSMSSWGESRWLYWLDYLASTPHGHRIWFMDGAEAETLGPPNARFVEVGRGGNYGVAHGRGWLPIIDFDSRPWTGHSAESEIAHAARVLRDEGAEVVLFHGLGKRLKKWIRDEGLNAVVLSSSRPHRLRTGVG